jgi:hypothetical protein
VEKPDGIQPEKLTKKGAGSIRSDILVFAVFLFLSFIFWYLNSLGKAIQSDITYPVKFINIPRDRQLAEAPARLNLFLQGTGFSMLKLKISGKSDPAVIDLLKVPYKSVRNNKSTDYYLVTSGLVQNFNAQLKPECRITSVKPDTLFFSFKEEAGE